MADCKVDIKNSDASFIARQLRKTADQFDPWVSVRAALFWMFVGASVVASMDYADLWICVGNCDGNQESN